MFTFIGPVQNLQCIFYQKSYVLIGTIQSTYYDIINSFGGLKEFIIKKTSPLICRALLCKSMDWFLFDRDLRHERIQSILYSKMWDNYELCQKIVIFIIMYSFSFEIIEKLRRLHRIHTLWTLHFSYLDTRLKLRVNTYNFLFCVLKKRPSIKQGQIERCHQTFY